MTTILGLIVLAVMAGFAYAAFTMASGERAAERERESAEVVARWRERHLMTDRHLARSADAPPLKTRDGRTTRSAR